MSSASSRSLNIYRSSKPNSIQLLGDRRANAPAFSQKRTSKEGPSMSLKRDFPEVRRKTANNCVISLGKCNLSPKQRGKGTGFE